MPLTIEILPDPAAHERRLTQLVAHRSSPLERLNVLYGSALQKLASQRQLAESQGGALAAVYGFTPVDLAEASALLGHSPARRAWPAGGDLVALTHLLPTLPLNTLSADAPGLAVSMLRTLTDLREAAVSPADLPVGDLRTVYRAWRELVASCDDRTARYEDAISPDTPDEAVREALGGAPLIVSGIYDLTRIQRLLLARLSQAADVRMLLVAPSDDPASPAQRTLSALIRDCGARALNSSIEPAPLAPPRAFSLGDPTSEAAEIAARVLAAGRHGVAFHRIAVLHQQGAPADDRLCAALDRAAVPTWRIGGRPLAQTSCGQAARTLFRLLLQPEAAERGELLDWLSHRALRPQLLGVERQPSAWDRAVLELGLVRGLHDMRAQIEEDAAHAPSLSMLIADLADRSRQLERCDTWSHAADLLRNALDTYLDLDDLGDAAATLRDILSELRANDPLGISWQPSDAWTALNRALASRVLRDPRRLHGGVNVGALRGPARGIRYDAVFVAGAAERIIPAVGRQDPLLPDAVRAEINRRIPDALSLQRDRAHSDRHAWTLARRAATVQFQASWSRRGSAVGGPTRASSLLLEDGIEVERIESAVTPYTPNAEQVASGDWSRALEAPDERSFELALLTAASADRAALLPDLWPAGASAEHARRRRNAPRFTEFDGMLSAELTNVDWRPLDRAWTAAALKTYVACPYRFYLRHMLGIRAELSPARPDVQRAQRQAEILRQVLSAWARRWLEHPGVLDWRRYANEPIHVREVAEPIIDTALERGWLGPPAATSTVRAALLRDLERIRAREASEADTGWQPMEMDANVDAAPIRVAGGRTLRLSGRIDRIDRRPDGRHRAVLWHLERTVPNLRGFINGSSFDSLVALAGLSARDVPIRDAEVEYRGLNRHSHFETQTLLGQSLTALGDGNSGGALSDGARLRDALALIADQLEAANFIPNPGQPARDRPNCRQCPYESACTADLARRYEHKLRHDQSAVRDLETMRRQQV